MTIDVRKLLDQKGRNIWSVSPATTVLEAIEKMAEKNCGALLVMQGDRLAGIVSERDYTRKCILQDRSSKDTTCGDIMTSKVVTVPQSESIESCMALMTECGIRHLPVVDGDKVIGVVSIMDIVRSLIALKDQSIEDLEKYIRGGYA